jgi:serine/threonine-protein kinase
MLTGRLPFNGGSARSIVAQHVALEPPPVEHYAPEVPETIARVINRCLSKDPRRRWADATTFQHALRAAQRTGHRRRLLDRIRRALRHVLR